MKIQINTLDNVYVDTSNGHKYALSDIRKGEYVIKYGFPIGIAINDIKKDEHVHTHNLLSNLKTNDQYTYTKQDCTIEKLGDRKVNVYKRENGEIGIRNDIWIIPTVGCANDISSSLANMTSSISLNHPYGCSQLGDDLKVTQKTLSSLAHHPNAGGVLIVGLGCENNNIDEFKKYLGEYNPNRIKFLNLQTEKDEIAKGIELISELKNYSSSFKRKMTSLSKINIGLKCGGSDGYSGISANPLVGRISDRIIQYGGSCILTEVPEMFGAERILMNRCKNKTVYNKTVKMIKDFKKYFISYSQPIDKNPSPGNIEGGITTLEEKSLGCIQKSGMSEIVDVLNYGDRIKRRGLSLLNGPGNDMVSITNLVSSGAHLILFTTGRGTPLGTCVPTIKISSNKDLYTKKSNWIDFDSSPVIDGNNIDDELFNYIIDVIEGKETKNETNGYRQIALFKNGVTL